MKKPIKAISMCKLITDMLEKAYDYELTQPLQSKPIYQAKVMLITQQQVLGKTKNKRKMLKKELWKGSQLTYLVKVSQLISNSQKLKLVKKTGRLIHTGTHMLLLFQGDSHCTKK